MCNGRSNPVSNAAMKGMLCSNLHKTQDFLLLSFEWMGPFIRYEISSQCPMKMTFRLKISYSSGFSTESKNDTATKTTVDLAMIPNLNWLIHMAFARQDYKYCIEVIEYQFNETYDHEYLYYIKVSSIR